MLENFIHCGCQIGGHFCSLITVADTPWNQLVSLFSAIPFCVSRTVFFFADNQTPRNHLVGVLRHLKLFDLCAGQLAVVCQQLSPLGGRLHVAAAEPAGLHRRGAGLCRTRVPDLVRSVHHLCAVRDASVAAEVVHDSRVGVGHLSSDRYHHQQVFAWDGKCRGFLGTFGGGISAYTKLHTF